jgi:hypothetical protein
MANRRAAGLIALIVAVSVAPAALAALRMRRVTGTAERVIHAQGPCRGGVAITREEMAAWQAKTERHPISKTTFTVFAGDKRVGKPVTRFKTDRAGRFDVRLPAGMFCVMAGEYQEIARENPPEPAQPTGPYVDADCLRDRALACDAVLHVREDGARDVKLTLDTFTPCPQPWAQPCYRGPAPP